MALDFSTLLFLFPMHLNSIFSRCIIVVVYCWMALQKVARCLQGMLKKVSCKSVIRIFNVSMLIKKKQMVLRLQLPFWLILPYSMDTLAESDCDISRDSIWWRVLGSNRLQYTGANLFLPYGFKSGENSDARHNPLQWEKNNNKIQARSEWNLKQSWYMHVVMLIRPCIHKRQNSYSNPIGRLHLDNLVKKLFILPKALNF